MNSGHGGLSPHDTEGPIPISASFLGIVVGCDWYHQGVSPQILLEATAKTGRMQIPISVTADFRNRKASAR